MKDGWREEGRKKNKEKKEERRKGRTERRKEKVCSKSMFIDDMIKNPRKYPNVSNFKP